MKLFSTLALSALLLVPVTAAQALDVQVDVCVQARKDNKCAIVQDGTHNYARGAQVGEPQADRRPGVERALVPLDAILAELT